MGETEIDAEEMITPVKRKYSRKKKAPVQEVIVEEPVVVVKEPEHLAPAGKSLFMKEVQRFLGMVDITGIFDQPTKDRLSRWQQKKGLEVTGTMTLETKRRMGIDG